MMQSAEDWFGYDTAGSLQWPVNRSILGNSEMGAHGIVVIGVGGEDTA